MEGTTDVGKHISSHDYIGDSFGQCCSADERYDIIEKNIWIYASPVLIIFGTIGNILSGIVMSGKRLRKQTTSVYLIALAAVDTGILFSYLPWIWIKALFNISVLDLSFAYCKIGMFFMYFANIQAWILVCVNVERLAAIFLPLKAKRLFSRRSAMIQIAIVCSVMFIFYLHIFWTQTLVDYGSGYVCAENPDYFTFRVYVLGWIDMFVNTIVLLSVMFLSSIAMSVKLYFQSKFGGGSGSNKTTSVIVMLITICVFYTLSVLPITILLANTNYFLRSYGCCYTWLVIWPTFAVVMYSNNAVNFLLYSITAPRFREELRRILPWCKTKKLQIDVQSSTS